MTVGSHPSHLVTMKNAPIQSPADALERHLDNTDTFLAAIAAHLQTYRTLETPSWGHVGNAANVSYHLQEIAEFLGIAKESL